MRLLAGIIACSFAQPVLAAPAGFWQFEETPGFLADSSGNGLTLTNEGTVTPLVSGGPGGGQAAGFSGNNRLVVADSPLWHSTRFTVEAYFRANSVGNGTRVIVSHHNNAGDQRGWNFAEAGGKLRFAKSLDGVATPSVSSFSILANNDYYAAAIVDSAASQVTMVLKDLTAGTPPLAETRFIPIGTFDASAPLCIGSTGTNLAGSSFFNGVIDGVRFTAEALATTELQEPFATPSNPISRTKANGYKGIWFTLGQYSTYGDKYSGGLGTYTVNHSPLAIYSASANKTFFTYGGTTGPADRHLLIMAATYDHATHTVTKPTIVMDKNGVDDPHDNACLSLDNDGYVWIFVSGRNSSRKGFTYRSAEPFSTDGFSRVSPAAGETYTYPQVWHDPVRGFFHLLTIYNGNQRELFFRTSVDGVTWTAATPFAKLQGSYQVSGRNGDVIGTFFNRHPGGNVDQRTDLYYMQTADFGQTWTTADGTALAIPLTTAANPARVFNYSALGRLMYGIDLAFDGDGRPVLFYLTSANHQPGPGGEPRTLHTARWTGSEWVIRDLPASATPVSSTTHNYAAGSIWIDGGTWTVTAPTGSDSSLLVTDPNRYWGHGGELEHWRSIDQGLTWMKIRAVTENSVRNHGYVRKPVSGKGRFGAYWADGDPTMLTESHLYFGNADGTRYWELPYHMTDETARPAEVNPPYLRWQKGFFTEPEILDESFSGPGGDSDGDGRKNLVEYTEATNPRVSNIAGGLAAEVMEDVAGRFFQLGYARSAKAFDVLKKMEASDNLSTWQDIEDELFDISSTQTGDVIQVVRGHRPVSGKRFYRMKYEHDR